MARIPRVVLPGIPHHVTQRGNRRQDVFFSPRDYQNYLDFIAKGCAEAQTRCWAYCLMPNHVHLILVPSDTDGLRKALSEAHRKYTRMVNLRNRWRGHLWQERFHSFPMDELHLYAAVRYVELNPVRAGLVASAEDWPWSSTCAHINGKNSSLVEVSPMNERVSDWRSYLEHAEETINVHTLRKHSRTGRPLGNETFIQKAEAITGRVLRTGRPGPEKLIRTEK